MIAEIRIDRMDDIAVRTVGILFAGLYDKVFFLCLDHFNFVRCHLIVQSYGYNRSHRTLIKQLANLDIRDFHRLSSQCIACTKSVKFKLHRLLYNQIMKIIQHYCKFFLNILFTIYKQNI